MSGSPDLAPMTAERLRTVVNLPVQEGQTVTAILVTPVMVTLANLDEITVRASRPAGPTRRLAAEHDTQQLGLRRLLNAVALQRALVTG